MQVDDIRVFIPCKSYEQSQRFYIALGFKIEDASNDLCVCTFGECTFFLQRYYNKTFAENLMLQLCVLNIDEEYELISNLNGFDIRFEGIKRGRVELYGLKFVQSRGDLIAAQGL